VAPVLALLLLGAFAWRFFVGKATAPGRDRVTTDVAQSAPSVGPELEAAPAPSTRTAPAVSAPPSASSMVPAARATGGSSEKRRPPPKPTDVRYKDWLKDPF
jgi:hypothetical protein